MNNIVGKRLLIQGAGRGNLGLIKTAKEHGVYVVMTGLGGDYPCNPYADKICFADISDPEAVLKVAEKEKVDGAIICCSDTGLKAIGRCNDVLGLVGISEKSADDSSNKYLMKEKLFKAGVRTARFSRIRDTKELMNAVDIMGYPLIIKAVDLQGSRGINIIRNEQDLMAGYKETMSLTKQNYCIVEEYIEGKEFGAQSFVYNGELLFVLPHGDETIMCKTAVPIGHYMPYAISDELYNDVCTQVKLAVQALGFNNCAVNVDLIEKNGLVYVIELTGRVGANCLPELTGNYFGINYYEMILATALGSDPREIFNRRTPPVATLARMIKLDKNGVVKDVKVPDLPDTEIHIFVHEGTEVRCFTNCNDAVGEVIVKGESLEDCEGKMKRALSLIEITI